MSLVRLTGLMAVVLGLGQVVAAAAPPAQSTAKPAAAASTPPPATRPPLLFKEEWREPPFTGAVSYTHLTLPTILRV